MTIEEIEGFIFLMIKECLSFQNICGSSALEFNTLKKLLPNENLTDFTIKQNNSIIAQNRLVQDAKNTLLAAIKQYGKQNNTARENIEEVNEFLPYIGGISKEHVE